MFKLRIITPVKVLFEGDCKKVFLRGDTGEFEILDFHHSVISLLQQGDILVDQKTVFSIKKGIVRFEKQECVILAEE